MTKSHKTQKNFDRANIVVIRPSGVWNSRTPLNNYIGERRQLSRSTSVLALGMYALRHDADKEMDPHKSGRRFLKRIVKFEGMAGEIWIRYRKSYPEMDGKLHTPSVGQISADALSALYDVREMAVVRLSSIFESYAQCWALNYIAASLENKGTCSSDEMTLLGKFNPFQSRGLLPSWRDIRDCLPFLKEGLGRTPHCFRHPATRSPLSEPISPRLNALSVIDFWRAYRNLSIHSSRIVTWRFFERFGDTFSEMVEDLKYSATLEPGKKMPFHGDMYSQMAAALYRASLWMNEQLVLNSGEKRGVMPPPVEGTAEGAPIFHRSVPMFIPGDHETSWKWVSDSDFRRTHAEEKNWKLPLNRKQ